MKLPASLFGKDVGTLDIAGAFCKRKQLAKGYTAVEACRVLSGSGIIDAGGAGTLGFFQRIKLLKEQGCCCPRSAQPFQVGAHVLVRATEHQPWSEGRPGIVASLLMSTAEEEQGRPHTYTYQVKLREGGVTMTSDSRCIAPSPKRIQQESPTLAARGSDDVVAEMETIDASNTSDEIFFADSDRSRSYWVNGTSSRNVLDRYMIETQQKMICMLQQKTVEKMCKITDHNGCVQERLAFAIEMTLPLHNCHDEGHALHSKSVTLRGPFKPQMKRALP
jgi:hypothetical protein